MNRYATAVCALLLVVSLPGSAFPWGFITHFRGGDEITASLPAEIDPQVFIRANVGPDLAWTPFFSVTERTYIHTPEFTECLLQVAGLNPQHPNWLAAAYGWGVHQAFDGVAHSSFVPENLLLHALVESAVDTVIYYEGSPSGWEPLPRYRLGWDSCNPWLISEASRLYREDYDPEAKPIEPWMVIKALATLNTQIGNEYQFIRAKEGSAASEMFLHNLVSRNILPGSWEDYYQASLEAAQEWIDLHSLTAKDSAPTSTPIPATVLLLGSGLLGLAGCRFLRKPGS